jgi:hypothetical protein
VFTWLCISYNIWSTCSDDAQEKKKIVYGENLIRKLILTLIIFGTYYSLYWFNSKIRDVFSFICVLFNQEFVIFFHKIREQEGRTGPGIGISGKGENVEKACGRLNMVQTLCTHVCKWKNETC